jgi:uncharacterized protein YndB with AHSA1/START domain
MAADIEPVRQSVDVPLSPHDAFELFTTGIAQWWPYKDHFSRGPVETLIFEGRLGGELKEVCSDGVVEIYGKVLVWEPPRRVAIKWMVGHARGYLPTEVEVRFTATESGCRVDLEHRGFEAYGPDLGPKHRDSYDSGWPGVLGLFSAYAVRLLTEHET